MNHYRLMLRLSTTVGVMTRTVLAALSILSLFVLTVTPASASTINFSSFSQAGSGFNNLGTSATQSGFTFDSSIGIAGGNEIGVWQDSSTNHPTGGAASTSLLEFFDLSITTMHTVTNAAFDLNAIALAEWGANQNAGTGTFAVTFTGTRADNSTVSQTLTVNNNAGSPTLQNFSFSGFTNVVKVTFEQGAFSSGAAYQFDNIVVNQTPVPEPSAYFLLGTGLIALWGFKVIRKEYRSSTR